MSRGVRSKEEDLARSQTRSFCSTLGTKIRKIHSSDVTYISVSKCDVWPEGLITVYQGWQDVLDRLTLANNNPELVTDGHLVLGDEEFYLEQEAVE